MLLSSVISQEENLVGSQITEEESERLEEKSDLPLRYWHWNKCSDKSNENNNDNETKVRPGEGGNTAKNWVPGGGFRFSRGWTKVATSQSDLQGFKPIKGVGPVAANLATLRMIARAYSTHLSGRCFREDTGGCSRASRISTNTSNRTTC